MPVRVVQIVVPDTAVPFLKMAFRMISVELYGPCPLPGAAEDELPTYFTKPLDTT
jgi:hypothetical protein